MTVSQTPVLAPSAFWLHQQQRSSCVIDQEYIRSTSPLTVCYDDDSEADEPMSDILLAPSVSKSPAVYVPLNENGVGLVHRSDGKKILVTFKSTVEVVSIPSRRDYSAAMKRRLWTSKDEIRVNSLRAQMQLNLDDGDDDDHEDRKRFARFHMSPSPFPLLCSVCKRQGV